MYGDVEVKSLGMAYTLAVLYRIALDIMVFHMSNSVYDAKHSSTAVVI